MRRWISGGLAAVVAVATAVALTGCDSVSDTGFVGTWAREAGKAQSIVSIAREGDGYTFCWSREAVAGLGGRHICAAPGRTEVYQGPDLAYVYEFTVEKRDDSGDLYVTVEGTPQDDKSTPMQYVDRLELQPGGLALWSYQIELNHVPKETPAGPFRFTKISNDPN